MTKRERTYWLVNMLETEIENGAKASKQIKRLISALAKEQGVVIAR